MLDGVRGVVGMLPYPTLTLDTLGVVGYGYAGGTLKVCSCVGGRVDVIVGTAAAVVGTAARSLSRPYEERVRGAAAAVAVVGTAARSLSRPYPTEEDTTTEEETPDETPMAGRFVGGA